jgi:hypothetical protein
MDGQQNFIHLELKYCERCGGLFVRVQDTRRVYCISCAREMLESPSPRKTSTRPLLPGARRSGVKAPLVVCNLGKFEGERQ